MNTELPNADCGLRNDDHAKDTKDAKDKSAERPRATSTDVLFGPKRWKRGDDENK